MADDPFCLFNGHFTQWRRPDSTTIYAAYERMALGRRNSHTKTRGQGGGFVFDGIYRHMSIWKTSNCGLIFVGMRSARSTCSNDYDDDDGTVIVLRFDFKKY